MKKKFLKVIKNFQCKYNKDVNFFISEGLRAVPTRVLIINLIFQRVFSINKECKFPVHFTSRVIIPEKLKNGHRVTLSFSDKVIITSNPAKIIRHIEQEHNE